MEFLEGAGPEHRPRISVLINCGFLEPHQNDVAVDMVRLFCLENGYPFGACLKIGGGEAILGTPFAFLVRRSIRALARALAAGRSAELAVTMPLSPRSFVRASTRYWTQMGAANGCTPEQMASMDIEPRLRKGELPLPVAALIGGGDVPHRHSRPRARHRSSRVAHRAFARGLGHS